MLSEAELHLILLVHAAATWAMIGLIWFVQIVHYPLFARVGETCYANYQHAHQRLTTFIVAPLMLIEAGSAAFLVIARPLSIDPLTAGAGFGLIVIIWLSTAFLQVPCHHQLSSGFDARVHRRLITTNWIRTMAWTFRGIIALALLS